MGRQSILGATVAICALLATGPFERSAASTARATTWMAKLPLRFEANAGQWDPRVRFASRRGGTTLLITDEGMTMQAAGASGAVTIGLSGAKARAPRGERELATKSNFFLGRDATKWRTNVPNFARVRAHDALPGVDVVWHGDDEGLEYDLEVAAGVDAREIALDVSGADSMSIAADGTLEIATGARTLEQRPPRVTQDDRDVRARYVIVDAHTVRLALDDYDPGRPLLVDPTLAYSSYLGGALYDVASAVALDASGNVYVTGYTTSTDFPTKGAYQATNKTGDAFVTKLDASGSSIVYSTYLGGSSADYAYGIAVDSTGAVYLTGPTASSDFPTQGPAQSSNAGGQYDAFVTKLSASGSALVYSTYLGGSGTDEALGLAIDANGNAYVAGYTTSTDLPTKSALQASYGGGPFDAFVTKLSPSGASFVYSTYLGGSGQDNAQAIALDASGNVYVAGQTNSTSFPTHGPLQASNGGGMDAFVSKLDSAGASLVYSTYLGGAATDSATAIALDASGNAYVAGYTTSTNLATQGPVQASNAGGEDVFVTKLNAAGSSIVYSTYLGGAGQDEPTGVALSAAGEAYVTGWSFSNAFPTQGAFQTAYGGARDAFVTKLNASGSALAYSTYLGGAGDDRAYGVAGASGSVWLVGATASTDFPTQTPLQAKNATNGDAFIARVDDGSTTSGDAGADASAPDASAADGGGKLDAAIPPTDAGTSGDSSGTCHCTVVAGSSRVDWSIATLALAWTLAARRRRRARSA